MTEREEPVTAPDLDLIDRKALRREIGRLKPWSQGDPEGVAIYRLIMATVDAQPAARGTVGERLAVALDNLATHHELERVAGNTHSRPDRCEFVEQARAALQEPPAPRQDPQ